MNESPQISIVVPVKNESGNIDNLIKEIDIALSKFKYEIIYVDDGSTDNTPFELKNNLKINKRLRVLSHTSSLGQSAALRSGISLSKSPLIATLDGDGQNVPSDLPKMIDLINQKPNQLVLVGGVRARRKDSLTRLWASSFAKYCRFLFLKDKHPDSGCGIKVFHRELYMRLPYFDHMHRFLSALVQREGGIVLDIEVNHRQRMIGNSNYTNVGRFFVGIFDMLGVVWLLKRMPKDKTCKEIFND
ncbi:MAG: glycosyltransferase family 2 protein [Alphaproteobacteria bacterium]|nr:glycosyltransferase family 2 protein [Alphaproteobacteria bacterium]